MECPVCGWTPDDPDDEDAAKRSVIAHMQGSGGEDEPDNPHTGIGYEKAKQKLKVESAINGTDNNDTDSGSSGDTVGSDNDDSSRGNDVQDTSVDSGDEPSVDDSTGHSNGSTAGLGLSGENPFPDDQSSAEAAEQAPEQGQSNGEGSGIAVLGAMLALGLAVLGAVKGRGGGSGGQDEKNVL